MNVQKLINQYQKKIAAKDKVIGIIMGQLRQERDGLKDYDVEDLTHEKQNAQRDRQLYFQFTKDLEDLQSEDKVLLPKRLTHENGAKALLLGEFHEILEDENSPGNPFVVPVKWTTIKDIYNKIVSFYSESDKSNA